MIWSLIITLAILMGQLIKVSNKISWAGNGVSSLDLVVFIFGFYGLVKLKFHLRKPPFFIVSACLFIVIATASLLLTPLHLQPAQYLISFFYTLRFSAYILLSWLVYLEAFRYFKKHINITLVFSGLSLAILGLFQFIFLPDLTFMSKLGWDPHYFRTISTFLDPNFSGAFFVLTLLLLKRKPKIFFVIVYLALLTTFSRSGYLMFLVSGLSFSFLEKSKKMAIKTILLFMILILSFQAYTQFVSKPRNIDREQSATLRLNTWQQGLILFQKFPILGIGFNSYRYALREFKLGDEEFLISHGASSNDSSLLFVAATTGIIGLIAYLSFLSLAVKTAWGKNIALISAIWGLLIHSFFANSLFYPPILLWILLISSDPKK